jgi:ACS family hexuronate transporter-like MFS transporter
VAEISRPAEEANGAAAAGGPPARFRDLLLLRNFWVIMAVAVTINLAWHFLRIWMPRFLVVDLKFSQRDLQYLLAGYFVAADLGSMASGWATQRLTRTGWPVAAARKVVMFGVAGLCLLTTPAVLLVDPANPWPTVLLMFAVGAGALGGFAIYFSLTQDISARHTSLVLGFTSTVSWVMVAVIQPYVGRLVDGLGTFGPCFIAAGCVPLAGAVAGLFWREPAAEQTAPDDHT